MSIEPTAPVEVLSIEEVAAIAPALTPSSHEMVAAAANANLRRVAPCVADGSASADVLAEARWILTRAVERLAEVRGWVRAESTGPYRAEYGDVPSTILSASEEATLARLCGGDPAAPTPSGGLPAGSFPTPSGIETLYPPRSALATTVWWP